MRWNLKKAELGTKRTVRRFAFWPIRLCDDNTVVWLESYLEDQRYGEFYTAPGHYSWMPIRRHLG